MFSERQVLVEGCLIWDVNEAGTGCRHPGPQSAYEHITAAAGQQVHQGAQQGALAGTVGTGKQSELARLQAKIGMGDYRYAPQLHGQFLDFQRCFTGSHRALTYQNYRAERGSVNG